MDAEFWTAAAAIASAGSAIFAAVAATQARRQIALVERSTEASVVLEISKTWNSVYAQYRQLLNEPVDINPVIAAKTNFARYAVTEDWQRMRPIFAFYEFLGAAIRTGFVKEPTLFSLVTVDTGLWDAYQPLILHFRKERPDLYTAWEYLTERRKAYAPGEEHIPIKKEGFLRRFFGGRA